MQSINHQTCQDWRCCVVLDPVGDKTFEKASAYASDRIDVLLNAKQMFALPNIIRSINMMSPKDDDIIVTVDADDWLYSYDNTNPWTSLDIVKSYYDKDPNLCLTHGSWYSFPDTSANTNNCAYGRAEFDGNIRKTPWRASHLRTFKYKLWKNINVEDLKDEKGEFYMSAWDCAFGWPMLEMAGYDRIKFIPEHIYTYNQETEFNDAKVRGRQQMYYTDYLADQPQYKYKADL
jgi:hypothetical protein